jgi:hypothetical protein
MARLLSNCFIKIDGQDFSGIGTNVAIAMSSTSEEIKEFGSTTIQRLSDEIVDWTMAMEFNADETLTSRFFGLVGKVVAVEVRASADARSATNPSYVGTAILEKYTPLSGARGDTHSVSVDLIAAAELRQLTDPLAV